MKRLLRVLLAVIMIISAISMVACGSDNDKDGKTGLLYKKFAGDSYYTVYGYKGTDTTLNIGAYNKDGIVIGRIKTGAFKGNNTLTEIIVPASVEEIDAGAFKEMKKLEKITLPFVGANANSDARYNPAGAENKAVDEMRTFAYIFGTEEYDSGAKVSNDYGIKEATNSGSGEAAAAPTYYIPATLYKVVINAEKDYAIPMNAFNGLTQISSVELKGKITAIGEGAFKNFTTLKSIIIPESVKVIYDNAFNGASKLESVEFKGTLDAVKESAFVGTALKTLTLNSKEIGRYAFAELNLNSINVNSDSIGAYAFYGSDEAEATFKKLSGESYGDLSIVFGK